MQTSAENARTASALANGVSDTAQCIGDLMDRVVRMMKDIDDSSRHIATIDGIAFQTNIFAFNAAVEAERASEQGRGFTVVVGEVRGLAQRSADASQEIRSLIQASVARVEGGNQIVEKAGAVIRQVVQDVKQVTDIVGRSVPREWSRAWVSAMSCRRLPRWIRPGSRAPHWSSRARRLWRKHQAHRLNEVVRVFRLELLLVLAS